MMHRNIKLAAVFSGLLFCGTLFAQEPVENVKPLDWARFQETQEEMVKQQLEILSVVKEIRETNRQLNINLLSWQTAKQDILQAVGNTDCSFWKAEEDQRVKWVVLGLAAWGVLITFNQVSNLFKRKETKTA